MKLSVGGLSGVNYSFPSHCRTPFATERGGCLIENATGVTLKKATRRKGGDEETDNIG
jgi:hypothetical protein